jgi:hypothetical protein
MNDGGDTFYACIVANRHGKDWRDEEGICVACHISHIPTKFSWCYLCAWPTAAWECCGYGTCSGGGCDICIRLGDSVIKFLELNPSVVEELRPDDWDKKTMDLFTGEIKPI